MGVLLSAFLVQALIGLWESFFQPTTRRAGVPNIAFFAKGDGGEGEVGGRVVWG